MPDYAGKVSSSTLRPLLSATVIHSVSFLPLTLLPSCNRARNRQCANVPPSTLSPHFMRIVGHTAEVVTVGCDSKEHPTIPRHLHLHSHYIGSRARCCVAAVVTANREGQEMANDAKALLSALLSFVCAAAIVTKGGG